MFLPLSFVSKYLDPEIILISHQSHSSFHISILHHTILPYHTKIMVDSLCTGTKDESGIMIACFLILEMSWYSSATIEVLIDENFPDYCCWRDESPTDEHTKIWRRSRAFVKGHQLLAEKAFVGVKLPEEKEPTTGITLDTLEKFFDKVAAEKGVTWRPFSYYVHDGEECLQEFNLNPDRSDTN